MKPILSLLIVLLTLMGANAQKVSVATDPLDPGQADAVRLSFARDFPSPCYETTASVNRNGNTIEVQLTSVPTGDICIPVIRPQSATINLGQLEPGIYQVPWVWSGIPGSRDVTGTFSFQVVPSIQLSGNDPAELRFQSATETTYQAQWSPDLVRWFDFGSPAPGTGDEIVIKDTRPPATNRFYRIQQTTE